MDNKENEIRGSVKWFSKSSNYGFITSEENIDYYFNADDLKTFSLDKGDEVSFVPTNSKAKFKAKNVKLIQKSVSNSNLICCPQCKKNMIPEIKTTEVSNQYLSFIKTVKKNYECPECEHSFGSYDEDSSTTNILANLIICTIAIFLLYQIYCCI